MESRLWIRRVFRDASELQRLGIDPRFVTTAAQDHHRFVRADGVQHFFLRTGLIKDPFRVTQTEIVFTIRILLNKGTNLFQNLFRIHFDFQIDAAKEVCCQDRMAVAVNEARKHHFSFQIHDFCGVIAVSLCPCFVSYINNFISFYCYRFRPGTLCIDGVDFSVGK